MFLSVCLHLQHPLKVDFLNTDTYFCPRLYHIHVWHTLEYQLLQLHISNHFLAHLKGPITLSKLLGAIYICHLNLAFALTIVFEHGLHK